jgi:hypothetical protein
VLREEDRERARPAVQIDDAIRAADLRGEIAENLADDFAIDLNEAGETRKRTPSISSCISGDPNTLTLRRPMTAFSLGGSKELLMPIVPGSFSASAPANDGNVADARSVVIERTASPEELPTRAIAWRAPAKAGSVCGSAAASQSPAMARSSCGITIGHPSIGTMSCERAA